MRKSIYKKIKRIINSRELKTFKKELKNVRLEYEKKAQSSYYEATKNTIFLNKVDLSKTVMIHELTHYKDLRKSNLIKIKINKRNKYMEKCCMCPKYQSFLKQTIFSKKRKKTIENFMEKYRQKKIRRRYFKKYKNEGEYLEANFLDIFNTITGGRYVKTIFNYFGGHNKKYYKKGGFINRYLEINAEFTSLINVMGEKKVKKIFTEMDKKRFYNFLTNMSKTAKKEYIK